MYYNLLYISIIILLNYLYHSHLIHETCLKKQIPIL